MIFNSISAIDLCNRPTPHLANHNPCGENSACSVDNNKVYCSCNSGYFSLTKDGRYCLPTNYCNAPGSDNGGCGANSLCTNPQPNIIVCSCNAGYKSLTVPADGRKCAPASDTCGLHPHICGTNSQCTNDDGILGAYTCACNEGYVTNDPSGKNCLLNVC
jgi:hypothetical protein